MIKNLFVFFCLIRRYKLAMSLNILGLSVAFSVFMVIMSQVYYDYSFDQCHKYFDKIYRLEYTRNNSVQTVINRPFAVHFFNSSPYILAGTLTRTGFNTTRFYVEKDDKRHYFEERSLSVSPSFFDVFTFDFIVGSSDVFFVPGNVIIPLSISQKLFGNEIDVVGKQIFVQNWGVQTVQAVYRDLPANNSFGNILFFAMPEDENKESWNNFSYQTYIRVNDSSNISLIIDNFKRHFKPPDNSDNAYDWLDTGVNLRLTALRDLHYVKDVSFDGTPKGTSKQLLMILITIALAIVTIAVINYINFNISLAPMRIKSFNLQRVFGVNRRSLRVYIVFETIIFCFLSYLISIFFFLFFFNTPLSNFVNFDAGSNPLIIGAMALITLIIGLFAGLNPAHYMTSFEPALVINGNFGLTSKGKSLRNVTTSIQFIISFSIVIFVSFMQLQNRMMQNSPLGFERDFIITANISNVHENREELTNRLKGFSGIEDVTFCENLLSSSENYGRWQAMYKGERIKFVCFPVYYNFLKTLGIEISEGRDFRWDDEKMENGVLVFNETAKNTFNMVLNSQIEQRGEIIGFFPDIIYGSFRTNVEPMAFYIRGNLNTASQPPINIYIRIKSGADMHVTKSFISTLLSELIDYSEWKYPIDVRFYDEILQQLYEKEISMSKLISFFSLIAILISIVGVFGLVVFDSEYRRKEVGIRKVHGATSVEIIIMFNKEYLKILLICIIITIPLSWYAVNRWLENFTYKTPMYWWVFVLTFLAVSFLVVSTVVFQTWRVANDNPVKSIMGK